MNIRFLKINKSFNGFVATAVTDNNIKMDLWARRYSQLVSTNLCPYFDWWKFALTAETRSVCQGLPEWKEDPTKRFSKPALKVPKFGILNTAGISKTMYMRQA